ncbi:MFS maltose permease [Hirsutella rhossiliensis]|uniref:MFS maltose permease n=1 Tax=Hirsutella rhossiliensis TaxID=111463 RepID=A0A9P8MLD4_9HYPO|nr:MFS maltose permease [Hirsutella rhossiliensis]KAH0958408.1 MFS maltose permease [Hirsutella rhossiliensis]
MRPRLVVRRRPALATASRPLPPPSCRRSLATVNSIKARPVLPFLLVPRASPSVARSFTSERRQWLKHEAKLVVRYTLTFWGILAAVAAISFAIHEEVGERDFPTPHEWHYLTRKFLRDAHRRKDPKDGDVNWAMALDLARTALLRLEDGGSDGARLTKLSDREVPALEVPGEFIHYDISANSEEWRRGYFDAIMLAAKAAEHVDGWVRDRTRNVVSPPEFVIGPSNPRPAPIPPGNPHAPREEDCDPAYPSADNWYMKILATKGFMSRQMMEAALEYASFVEFKGRADGAEALYSLALAEATKGSEPSTLPFDPKTLVLKHGVEPASMNILDALTASANFKARRGDVSSALPMYISLLKTRRSLADIPPPEASSKPRRRSLYQQVTNFFAPPPYPAPPVDGSRPPWRSPYERCQEASLHLYIGEIMYANSSHADGLAWTRDGVDLAEEQLRALSKTEKGAKQTCRECLATGLDNWSTMVARLARAEEAKGKSGSKSAIFSLWSGPKDAEGRWAAEEAVVQERMRRTAELMEDIVPPETGLLSYFKA